MHIKLLSLAVLAFSFKIFSSDSESENESYLALSADGIFLIEPQFGSSSISLVSGEQRISERNDTVAPEIQKQLLLLENGPIKI